MDNFKKTYQQFLNDWPTYHHTNHIDTLRKKEYPNLDRKKHIYLDYTGSSLYSLSQVKEHHHFLAKNIFGNPHSINPTSRPITEKVQQVRKRILSFFNTNLDKYALVFTANSSCALKLVGESWPFEKDSTFLLTLDNHNSVLGIREYAKRAKASVQYLPQQAPNLQISKDDLKKYMQTSSKSSLFAFPAQSNSHGIQYPLSWIDKFKHAGFHVLLDAAAFVPTNVLNLKKYSPDLVNISFYKMFGYPTGLGALLIRREIFKKLKRPWFSGGTIVAASAGSNGQHQLLSDEGRFEDGTINFLAIPAIEIGLDHIEKIGLSNIHNRVAALTNWLICNLKKLKHSNQAPLVKIYGRQNGQNRGSTISLNLLDKDKNIININHVQTLANKFNISLRTGCFCNPGSAEILFKVPSSKIGRCFSKAPSFKSTSDYICCLETVGSLRISFGIVSNFADVYKFLQFVKGFI